MAKAQKNFLIAVQGQPGWYQAVAARRAGHAAFYVPNLEHRISYFQVPGFFIGLQKMLPVPPELSNASLLPNVIRACLDHPQRVQKSVTLARKAELGVRHLYLASDAETRLARQYGEEYVEALIGDLTFMRTLSDSYYMSAMSCDTEIELCTALERIAGILESPHETQIEEKLAAFLEHMPNATMLTLACAVAPEPLSKSTRDRLMQNWDKLHAKRNGQRYDGFKIDNERFIHKSAIERLTPHP